MVYAQQPHAEFHSAMTESPPVVSNERRCLKKTINDGLPDLYNGLARSPTARPSNLTQVLYLPRHDTPNFPLYNVSGEFKQVIQHGPFGFEGDRLIGEPALGSRLFNTRLRALTRPRGTGTGSDDVKYLVYPGCGQVLANVQKRDPKNNSSIDM